MYSVRIISGSRSFGSDFYIRCIAAVSRSIIRAYSSIRLAEKKKGKIKKKRKGPVQNCFKWGWGR